MDFDSFCALCGGPFRKRSLGKERMFPEPSHRSAQDSSPCECCREGPKAGHQKACYKTYSPELISWPVIGWLGAVSLLGIHPGEDGQDHITVKKVFRRSTEVPGAFQVPVGDGHWLDRGVYSMTGYYNKSDGSIRAFPFHMACFRLFEDAFAVDEPDKKVDEEILFATMRRLTKPGVQALALNYGDLSPGPRRRDGHWERKEQLWESLPGEEFLVAYTGNDDQIFQFKECIETQITHENFRENASLDILKHLQAKVLRDPFSTLPFEVLENICQYVEAASLIALNLASWNVHAALCGDDTFWKRALLNTMPWLYEMHDLLTWPMYAGLLKQRNWKHIYIWLEKITRPRLFVEERDFLGVTNRRRIWNVCEELLGHYHATKRLNQQ